MAARYSSEEFEILYTENHHKDSGLQHDVAAQRTKVWDLGDTLEIQSFPVWSTRSMKAAAQDALRKMRNRKEVNDKLHARHRRAAFRRLLEYNFGPKDLMITLTYDYGRIDYGMTSAKEIMEAERHYPLDEMDARKDVQIYIRKVRRRMKKLGMDPAGLKYMYVIEAGRELRDGEHLPIKQKYHIHMIMSGVDRETAEELWPHGFANSKRLQPNAAGLAQLAAYLTKQKGFFRQWARSKNVITPQPSVSDRQISRRRVARMAEDVQHDGIQILRDIYPGYEPIEQPQLVYSEFCSGVYLYARLRRIRKR